MRRYAGLLLLVVVVVVVVVMTHSNHGKTTGGTSPGTAVGGDKNAITLKGYIGGEKINFLKDPDVQRILQDRYGLTVDYDRRGSLEMARAKDNPGIDFLWPSSEVALEMYKTRHPPAVGEDIIFKSPIVLYSWVSVTEALINVGVVRKEQGTYYVVDFPKLVRLMEEGKQWKDIGMPDLFGRVVVYSTDPILSNSGNMFAGLLANVLNGGQVVNDSTVANVLPTVRKFFEDQGFMEQTSDMIFRQFLTEGKGAKAVIVGYEAQLLEYSVEHPEELKRRQDAIRLLYPKPTVWSSHPLIALTANGKRLIEALQDLEVQRLAWQRHGFRSATGAENDPSTFAATGIPNAIENAIPMPSAHVMERIWNSLATH